MVFLRGASPFFLLLISLFLHFYLPDQQFVGGSQYYSNLLIGLLILSALWIVFAVIFKSLRERFEQQGPLLSLLVFLLLLWELFTLKWNLLPLPFFPSPVKVLEGLVNDFLLLIVSTLYSLRLLFLGYLLGAFLGLITGTMMGWYQKFRYWVNPFIRFIGPIPSTAWIPIALVIFPGSFSASVFLIVLAAWFPVTVMTWTGISNVNKSFFEAAQTLGADEKYLITRVALPAALPQIFVGLFMGLGVSFVTLIVAEMLGVKAGLGWYIQWAQGWGEYYKVYASLLLMAVIFSFLISLLFGVRDRLLIWQKGLIKW